MVYCSKIDVKIRSSLKGRTEFVEGHIVPQRHGATLRFLTDRTNGLLLTQLKIQLEH